MAAITIRALSEEDKQRLRERAAANGRSMEAEARAILVDALASGARPIRADISWMDTFIEFGRESGGAELDLPPRTPMRHLDFDDT